MNRTLAIALVLSATAAFAGVNSPTDRGYLDRSARMLNDGNYVGCIDQLSHIDRRNLTGAERQQADWLQAEAAYHTTGAAAVGYFRRFIALYPTSIKVQEARKRIGDCLYLTDYKAALRNYLQVEPSALTKGQRNELDYRTAYCYLRLGEFRHADELLAAIPAKSEYANAAKFYRGYIEYVNGDYDAAEATFRGVNTSTQPGCMADYYLAQIYYSRGDFARALSTARAVLRRADMEPAYTAEANRIAGEALYQTGQTAEAVPYLKDYVAATEQPAPTALYVLGVSEYLGGEYRSAIEHLQPVTDLDNAAAQSAYLYIGQALMKEGDTDAALMAFDKASRMNFDPQVEAAAFYNYAVAKTRGGRIPFGSSVPTFEEFLRRYPDSPYAGEVQEYIVTGYLTDNDYERALATIDGIANPTERVLAAKQQILYTLGARSVAAGNAAEAYSLLTRARELAAHDPALALENELSLGEAAYRLGKFKEAEKGAENYLRGAGNKAPNRAVALYDMGYALMGQRRYNEAAKYFDQALEMRPEPSGPITADIYNRLADIAYYSSDFSKAASLYDKAYNAYPAAGDYSLFQKAIMKGYQRNYKAEIEELEQLCTGYPSSALIPEAMLEMAQCHIRLSANVKAIATYRRLIEAYPSTVQGRQAYIQLAQTLMNEGRTAEAKETYREIVTLYPTGDEALMALQALKQIHADAGTLNEFVDFVATVPDAPAVDVAEMDALAFEAAERRYAADNSTAALEQYLTQYPRGNYRAKAITYLMNQADGNGDTGAAAAYADRLLNEFPDNAAVEQALAIKAGFEYDCGRSRSALELWKRLAQHASTPAMANRARLGVMRAARDIADYDTVIEAANAILSSSTAGTENKHEATFSLGLAQANKGDSRAARDTWVTIADNTDDLYGAKSAFYRAESLYEDGLLQPAAEAAEKLTASGTPHTYWLARGFILLSDIYAAQGKTFEAREYLKALRENYPGRESDIFLMIDQRLEK